MGTALMGFVRDFGLLQPNHTPCGKPLTVSQAHALDAIASYPAITQRDLGETLGLARATTSELVAQLADRGWITQYPSDTDRRQRSLQLTPVGTRVTTDVAAARQALMRELLAHVPPGDRARFVDSIELLVSTVHQYRTTTADTAEHQAS
jgi:DNA-binding MarR family transcriptional regulator